MKIGLLALLVLIILAIVGKKAGWIGKEDSLKVSVQVAHKRAITESVLANGKILPEKEVKISSEISGEIIRLMVNDGDSVYRDDLLLEINPELVKAALDRSSAAVNNSRANLNNAKARARQAGASLRNQKKIWDRNKELYAKEVISEDEFLRAQFAYESAVEEYDAAKQSVKAAEYTVASAQASMKEVNENLERTAIYSPIDGIVTRLGVEQGERVVGTAQMQGTEMMRIADLSLMQANVDVSEADIVNVSIGDTALVDVDAYPNQVFKGLVREIANSANSTGIGMSDQVTNFAVKIDLLASSYTELSKENNTPFRPGMSASVEILTKQKTDVLSVPIQSVTVRSVNEDGKVTRFTSKTDAEDKQDADELLEMVFVVEEGKAVSKKVETGIQDDRYIEITSGLEDSLKVIDGPFSAISKKLYDDLRVQVVDRDKLFEK